MIIFAFTLQVHGTSIILKKRIILKLIQGYPDWNTKMDMQPDFGMNTYHICVRNSMEPTLVQVNLFWVTHPDALSKRYKSDL